MNIDKLSQNTIIEPKFLKTKKRCNKVNTSNIKWSTISILDVFINNNIISEEKLAPHTLIKWSMLTNIWDIKSIVDFIYK